MSLQQPSAPVLFVLGFLCALVQVPLGIDAAGFGDHFDASVVARQLATTGEFRDPFALPTGLTAHVAPVYPAILAAAIRIFRREDLIVTSLLILTACLMGLAAALLPALAQAIYGSPGPGVAGAVLLILSGRMIPQWEMALSATLLITCTIAILWLGPVKAGLWVGVSAMTNPLSLPALGMLALQRGKRFGLTVVLVGLAVCVPWTLRNWVAVGTPYFVRDNAGIELYLSNTDRSEPELVRNSPLWDQHPSNSPQEAAKVVAMGEGPYNQMRMRDAFAWITSHPQRFIELSAARAFYYWFPSLREGWPAYGYWAITILAIAGAWSGRANRSARFIGAAALVWSLPFLVIQTDVRYRFPSLWMTALLAGYAVWTLRPGLLLQLFQQNPGARDVGGSDA